MDGEPCNNSDEFYARKNSITKSQYCQLVRVSGHIVAIKMMKTALSTVSDCNKAIIDIFSTITVIWTVIHHCNASHQFLVLINKICIHRDNFTCHQCHFLPQVSLKLNTTVHSRSNILMIWYNLCVSTGCQDHILHFDETKLIFQWHSAFIKGTLTF